MIESGTYNLVITRNHLTMRDILDPIYEHWPHQVFTNETFLVDSVPTNTKCSTFDLEELPQSETVRKSGT